MANVAHKELDIVPEDLAHMIQPKESPRPRPNHNSHDPRTTIFTNGHHKPVHKFNDAHNQLGAPYKVPSRSHSLHGHREIAQRSTDNLLLTKSTRPFQESPLHHSITDAMAMVERKTRSEHNSPILGPQKHPHPPLQDLNLPHFDPSAYSYSPFGADTPPTQTNSLQNSQNASQSDLTLPDQFPESWFMTYEQAHDYDPPKYNELASVDWSSYNLENNGNVNSNNTTTVIGNENTGIYGMNQFNSPNLGPPSPYQPFDLTRQINQIGVNSSTGDVSEVDEQSPPSTRWNNDQKPLQFDQRPNMEVYNDFSSATGDEASDRYRLSSASSYFGTPQANMLANDNIGSLDIDDYLQRAEAETKRLQSIQMQQQMAQMQMASPGDSQGPSRMSSVSRGMTPSVSTPGSAGIAEHPFTIREAQMYAHMNGLSNEPILQQRQVVPATSMAEDPSWSVAPDMSNPELSLAGDEREDEDWVR
ncbi:transcriptional activator haa1 [Exophiala xenobiotica]|uniref:Transcriptional activator haa1 n=1 Tax=Vermiconidia calcicola TaxID=1690605 RepID=A0AAV9QJJ3_9PEZI|nr:transcriptional activator haa1 [Exophiala xenobiotica]KAK5425992.1 transcriptional activator haa1 [Exophiala xenobiotica]KAK5539416.1 transcriptional activator haa1 [Chaetothyriales sp. CCFEE 6169]KAK5543498.1 transcriptional activator haa1 [Vermiconidia calcicola]